MFDPHNPKLFEGLKKALDASGFPLETTVEQILRDASCKDIDADFPYERPTAERPREVDIVASAGMFGESGDSLEGGNPEDDTYRRLLFDRTQRVVVECKRRRDGVIWLFTPFGGRERPRRFGRIRGVPSRGTLHLTGVTFDGELWLDGAEVGNANPDRVCLRGTEFRAKLDKSGTRTYLFEEDSSSIRDAAHQAGLAMLPVAYADFAARLSSLESFKSRLGEDRRYGGGFAYSISAYVVTTAPIFCLKPGVGLSQIGEVTTLTEIADQTQRVELHLPRGPEYLAQVDRLVERLRGHLGGLDGIRRKSALERLEVLAQGLSTTRPAVSCVSLSFFRDVLEADLVRQRNQANQLLLERGRAVGCDRFI